MFSRSKDKNTDQPVIQAAAPMAPSPSGKRNGVRTVPSIISTDLVVHGNLVATGDIQIDGTVEGDIRSQSLTIGEKASVNGEVVAEDIVIRGRVIGTIRGRRVQLASTCHVEGDILHEALAVETGAFFEGNCRHSDDPIGQASAKTPAARPVGASPLSAAPRPMTPRPTEASASPVVVGDGGVVVKRPAAQ
jgi:cytoskeletal protein CcmA (bactofilin family)